MKTATYQERSYRSWVTDRGLVTFEVKVRETDLQIRAEHDLSELADKLVRECRRDIESYIARDRRFLTSLTPLAVEANAPVIVKRMAEDAAQFGVGPMAAVAGAIADCVGRGLLQHSAHVIVENGGDIFALTPSPVTFALFAGQKSPFTRGFRFRVSCAARGKGICTSSGTVGHSLSFGKADAAVVVAQSASYADAAATALGNLVRCEDDIERIVEQERRLQRVDGVVLALGGRIGIWGDIEVVE
ncbi:MAG: UPF0280 family protein [Planctomycetota bacterium]|nr:UPF0280 family protein [Planctomycetota bacterium]